MTRFWFDPTLPESGAMARSLARLGLDPEVRTLGRAALLKAQGATPEGQAPAVRRATGAALQRAGGDGPHPGGEAGTVGEALADGVFDLPSVVHEGRVFRDLRLRPLADALGRAAPPLPEAESTLPVDVYLDLADPASFIALIQAERLCGRGVRWHLVNGKSLRTGFGVRDPVRDGTDLERAWWRDELDRSAPAPLDWTALDVRPTWASRAALHLGLERTVLMHLFHALWVQGRPLGDREVLDAVLGELSLDGAAVLKDANPADLRTATASAEAAGVFTTPTFVVGRQRFVGLDALMDAGRAARVVTNLVSIGR